MKITSIMLAAVAAIAGLIAAGFWLRASKVPIKPMWGGVEPGDERLSQMGWTMGMMQGFSISGDLNAKAARWTAVSVGLAGISRVIGSLA